MLYKFQKIIRCYPDGSSATFKGIWWSVASRCWQEQLGILYFKKIEFEWVFRHFEYIFLYLSWSFLYTCVQSILRFEINRISYENISINQFVDSEICKWATWINCKWRHRTQFWLVITNESFFKWISSSITKSL